MKLAKVTGVVWATQKAKELNGCRLFLVQPISGMDEQPNVKHFVAADPLNLAASGDKVIVVTSTDAAQAFKTGFAPVNASIVELLDDLD
jgi:microcompartment protein CcmK/EutM